MPVQLQYVQLIMDKTSAADLSSGVLTILISVKIYCRSIYMTNSDVTKGTLNCTGSL